MANKQLSISHHLDQATALERTKQLLQRLGEQHRGQMSIISENWTGYDCAFEIDASGMTITGTIKVKPTSLDFSCDLPLIAGAFWGRIQSAITDAARPLLS